ncbi:MAG: ImmA/IrrE family metallo-endopeptidase [Chloroflexi bacterium]|nr:ImmA/IrrE family metallo-endopeptidase [Chloroflexota bacterium]
MAPRNIPASGKVLQWAREYSGLSTLRDAATHLGITPAALEAIEKDEAHPSTAIFNKMVQVYRTSESLLLLPNPPATPPLPTDYRTAGGTEVKPSTETVQAIRESQEFQRFVSELVADEPELFPHVNLPQVTLGPDVEALASKEREQFGVSLEQQRSWLMDGAFARWRLRMQARGILVLVKKMPWRDCRGFSLVDDGIPTIVVNSEDVGRARIFTLFHEFAHLLLRQSGICIREQDSPDRGRLERWCNEFAAAFLVPRDDLIEYVVTRFGQDMTNYQWQMGQVRSLATRYKVSRAVIALRLQTLSLAPQDYYDRNKAALYGYDMQRQREKKPNKPIKIKRLPGWRERGKLEEVGLFAASAIVEAWKEQVTDAEDVAAALGLSLDELFGLEDRVEVERRHYAAL